MNVDSIYFKGHLCFKDKWAGFDTIKPINVIIGRNNSGKSHLVDLIEALCSEKLAERGWQYHCKGILDEKSLQRYFEKNRNQGDLRGNHWNDHGRCFINKSITYELDKNLQVSNEFFEEDFDPKSPYGERSTQKRMSYIRDVLRNSNHQLNKKTFRKLLADRDIKIELPDTNLRLDPDGNGASNIVRRFIVTSDEDYPREVIQKELLSALNRIFGNDGQFEEIQIQLHDNPVNEETKDHKDHWEIYLAEKDKGLIPLSKSGSGLKTVILVLLNLLVIPRIDIDDKLPRINKEDKSMFVFAFEELENNLHPALLRRLFAYLEKFVVDENSTIFLTTHSSTALDFFGMSDNAQIIHVEHDGKTASSKTVSTHLDHLEVVRELGTRPSDLLQANGIVWVEGPSDRIYLNHWIHLYTEGRYQEGRDYQCAFYGGALLARTQFSSPAQADTELANLLQINSNIVVVCDSDRNRKGARIKPRVAKIKSQVKAIPGAHIWITEAKEIENYIPGSVLQNALNLSSLPDPKQYEVFFPSYVSEKLNKNSMDKVNLAISTIRYMDKNVMLNRFDWEDQMKRIVKCIESWNS